MRFYQFSMRNYAFTRLICSSGYSWDTYNNFKRYYARKLKIDSNCMCIWNWHTCVTVNIIQACEPMAMIDLEIRNFLAGVLTFQLKIFNIYTLISSKNIKNATTCHRLHIKCRNSIFGGKFLLQIWNLQCQIHVLSKHHTSIPIRSRDIDRSVFYQKVVCPWSYQKVVCHWMISPLYLYDNDICTSLLYKKIHFKAFGISSS